MFLFVAGATFSFFQGIRTVLDPGDLHEHSAAELGLAFGVLGAAFLFEGVSMIVPRG